MSGFGGIYGYPLYCATKCATTGFVNAMASAEERVGIKVVCICPGHVLPFHNVFYAIMVVFPKSPKPY